MNLSQSQHRALKELPEKFAKAREALTELCGAVESLGVELPEFLRVYHRLDLAMTRVDTDEEMCAMFTKGLLLEEEDA